MILIDGDIDNDNVCDIDEISEYLIKIGKEKDYPDIAKN